MTRIHFPVSKQQSVFHNPFQNNELCTQKLEIRTDPLTGHQSVFNTGLEGKAQILYPDTDYDYLEERARETVATCFLCPEDRQKNTPRYPEQFLPKGILTRGQATLFPNLFPVAAYHSVIRLGDRHLRKLDDLPPDLLEDCFGVTIEFVRRIFEYDNTMIYPKLNINYMLPAGASLVHPHRQILNSPTPSSHHRTDDYFLQKRLKNELILNPPEKLTQWMQKDFPLRLDA